MTAAGPPRITLIGRPGCHLCEAAEVVVARVADDLCIGWEKLSIDDDAALHERYWELIPVVLVDGEQVDVYVTSDARLRAALGA